MPHAPKSLVDIAHDLRWRIAPTKLEQLLPDVASVAVDDSLWDATEELMNHGSFVLLRYAVKSLLDDMATESIHAERKCVTPNSLRYGDDLILSTMLETTLHEEVAETVDHQSISLRDDGLNNVVLLLRSANFELLLKEDRGLLIVVADDLIDDVFPVAAHVTVKQATIVHRFSWCYVLGGAHFIRSLPYISQATGSKPKSRT